jgi:hypothetical protein
VKVMHGRLAWVRRLSFAAVVAGALIAPGPMMSSGSPAQCAHPGCAAAGTVRWARSLPGSWVVQNGPAAPSPGRARRTRRWAATSPPHYFVDLSGIGGSAPPGLNEVLLAGCAQVGAQPPGSAGPRCARPQLVPLNR